MKNENENENLKPTSLDNKPETKNSLLDNNNLIINKKLVIIGKCGTGKTSLLNFICGTDKKISNGLSSCTKNIYHAKKDELVLYDTPGFESSNDEHIAEHLNHIVLALTEGINGFLLCIEVGRLSEISTRLVECLDKHFPDFYKRTILVITHADKIWIENLTSEDWLSEQMNTEAYKFLFKFDKICLFSSNKKQLEFLEFNNIKYHYNQINELFDKITLLPDDYIYNEIIEKIKEAIEKENAEKVAKIFHKYFSESEPWYKKISNYIIPTITGAAITYILMKKQILDSFVQGVMLGVSFVNDEKKDN